MHEPIAPLWVAIGVTAFALLLTVPLVTDRIHEMAQHRREQRAAASGKIGAYVLNVDCPITGCPQATSAHGETLDTEATGYTLHVVHHHVDVVDKVRAIHDLLTVNPGIDLGAARHWHDKDELVAVGWLPFWCEWTHAHAEGQCSEPHTALPEVTRADLISR